MKKSKKFFLSAGSILAAIFVLNLLFLNAGTGDGPPPGAIKIGEGLNSVAYKADGWVYKIIRNGDTVTRDNLFLMHNAFAEKMPPGLIPPYEKVGNNTVRQLFVEGFDADQLSPAARANAVQNAKVIEDTLAPRAAGKAFTVSGRIQPWDRIYLLPNGGYAQVDGGGTSNYKFDANGNVLKWYDPILVGNVGDLDEDERRTGMKAKVQPPTQLPIDNGEKLKIAPDPTATGATGLRSLKTFTFLSSTMAVAGVGLVANDYRNQYNSATTDEQRTAAHTNFLKTLGQIVGFSVAAGAVIVGVTALSPFLGAAAAVSFVALGSVGLGTHIHATFDKDILSLWDKLEGRPPTMPDANHPALAKLRNYQSQQLQMQLKRQANLENRSTVEFRDIARVAVLQDSSFKQTFYAMPNSAGKEYRTGSFLSDIRVKELDSFRSMVVTYHEMGSKTNSTQEEGRRWAKEIVKSPLRSLHGFQYNTGAPIHYPRSFAIAVSERFTRASPTYTVNQTSGAWAPYYETPALAASIVDSYDVGRQYPLSKTAKTPYAGTLAVTVNGVSPSYKLAPILNVTGKTDLNALLNDPDILKKPGTAPVPIPERTATVTIRPTADGSAYCFDTPSTVRWLGNGLGVERNNLGQDILIASEAQPKAGGSQYSSFASTEVINGEYRVNGGLQTCSTAWVSGCGVTEAIPYSPFGLGGSVQDRTCLIDRFALGCPCARDPFSTPGCY